MSAKKAIVTNAGERYSTYRAFAQKHGYPDAVDRGVSVSLGEGVTLLTSGPHERVGKGTLWIVEKADGSRLIIGERGLKFVEEAEDIENVTVLTDEYGLQREYREVKRKAAVGERIKITATNYVDEIFGVGDIGTVIDADTPLLVDFNGNERVYGDGEWFVGPREGRAEYVALEPISAPLSTPPSVGLSNFPPDRQTAEIIANLAQRMTSLETEVAELKRPKPSGIAQIGESLAKLAGCERKQYVEVARGPAHTGLPSFAERSFTRDDVIERAKADVARASSGDHRIDFVVNREKRTVVALSSRRWSLSSRVYSKGIAKCAPDDVFNVHIGKAIALRRALGLAVPDEYTQSPKPTEVRVGDLVKPIYTHESRVVERIDGDKVWFTNGFFAVRERIVVIIDDSREEVTV
jgi:hypothetical protein